MSDDLYLNLDHLVEFLTVAQTWYAAQSRPPERWTPDEHEDLVVAAGRLFTAPEPAPTVPAELVAALRAWQSEATQITGHLLRPEVRRLLAVCQSVLPAPDPPRCAVPGCGVTLTPETRRWCPPPWDKSSHGGGPRSDVLVCQTHHDWLLGYGQP